MTSLTKIDLKESYLQNTIWENLFQINFRDTEFWNKELSSFVHFLNEEANSFVENQLTWNGSYFRFKKLVSIVKYFANYFSNYSQIHFHRKVEVNELLEVAQNDINNLYNKLYTDKAILKKFKEFLKLPLSEKQKQIVNTWLISFFQDHHNQDVKKSYNNISYKLQNHITDFLENNNELYKNEEHSIFIPKDKAVLTDGLKIETIEEGFRNAKELGLRGWLFYMNEYTALKLIRESNNRNLRKKAYQKYQKINRYGQFTLENGYVLKNILQEKHRIAKLMGKNNYAELVLSKYLMNTPNKAYNYLDNIEATLLPKIQKIEQEIIELANKDKISELKAWDVPYYFQKLNLKYNPGVGKLFENYFSFEEVFPKIIKFFEKSFNLSVKPYNFKAVGNDGIYCYRVEDLKSKRHGYFLISPWNNPKKQLCYQIDYLKSDTIENGFVLPNVQFIELQIKRGKDGKSPMEFWDMVTTIHEFGHAFHSFFDSVDDHINKNLAMSWDLIEMPSQFLEHFVYDYGFMKSMSSHCVTKKKITKNEFLAIIQNQQYLDCYYTYCNIQKYKAQLWIHEQFQPYSLKNLQEMIESKLSKKGIIYNIAQDEYMTYSDYNLDYGPTGYIYLYSAQLAFQLFRNLKNKNLRGIYSNIFNSRSKKNLKDHINKNFNLTELDIEAFIKKNLPISLYE